MSNLVSVSDYREEALRKLPRMIYEFFRHGASNEETLMENSKALQRLYIKPRVLRDVSSHGCSQTMFLGHQISAPIGISPTALHEYAHPQAECATAKGASEVNVPFVLSFNTGRSMEDIAEAAPSGIHLFQFYPLRDKDITVELFQSAEKNGFKGLVMTVDFSCLGVRYLLMKDYQRPAHVKSVYNDKLRRDDSLNPGSSMSYSDPSATWDYVKWVKSVTRLPLILKGILSEKDAELAIEAGVDAIWVSNHGGRQLDGVIPTIEALPEIVKIVKRRLPVFIDCGFGSGSDIFKALALGADMVFLGRPIIWALASKGEEGVKDLLELMKKELTTALVLTGCLSVGDVTKELVIRKDGGAS